MKHGASSPYLSVLDPTVAGIHRLLPRGQFSRFKLWHDPILNKSYEEYIVSAFGTEKDYEIYQFRKDQWQNLISVYHVSETNSYGFKQLRVFTERIPRLLSQMGMITFVEYLYVLRESLIGFQAIVERFGYIHVEDRMIGVNSQGKVRVWNNSKYEKNHSEVPIAAANWINSKKYQYQMVRSLFEALGRHVGEAEEFGEFQRNKPKELGFREATGYLFDYIGKTRIQLPDSLGECEKDRKLKRQDMNHNSSMQLLSKPSISTTDLISSTQTLPYPPTTTEQNLSKSLQYIDTTHLTYSQSYQNIPSSYNTPSYTQRDIRYFQQDSPSKNKNQWIYDPYKKTKYFGEELMERRAGREVSKGKSKEKVVAKCSWTSKDMSFKSTAYTNQKKLFDKKNIYNRVAINTEGNNNEPESYYDSSFMIDSSHNNPSSTNELQRPRSYMCNFNPDFMQITKSVVIQNKQDPSNNLQNRKLGSKNLSIETGFNSDIPPQNPLPSAPSTPQNTKPKNLKSLNQYKQIFKSIIKPGVKKQVDPNRGLAMISQLKTSFFNKLDDLKKSEIISEHLETEERSSNIDLASPLLQRSRGSGLRGSNNQLALGVSKCNDEREGKCPFKEIEQGNVHRSAVTSKSRRALNLIVEADGQ